MKINKRCLALLISTLMLLSFMPALTVSAELAPVTVDFSGSYWSAFNLPSGASGRGLDGNEVYDGSWADGNMVMVNTVSKGSFSAADGKLTFTPGTSAGSALASVMTWATEDMTNVTKQVITFDLAYTGYTTLTPNDGKAISIMSGGTAILALDQWGGRMTFSPNETNAGILVPTMESGATYTYEITLDYEEDTISARVKKDGGSYSEPLSAAYSSGKINGIRWHAQAGPVTDGSTPSASLDNITFAEYVAAPVAQTAVECAVEGKTVTTTFTAGTEITDDSVYLVTALYDANGALVEAAAATTEIADGTATQTTTFTKAGTVKAFAWDADDKLTPLTAFDEDVVE